MDTFNIEISNPVNPDRLRAMLKPEDQEKFEGINHSLAFWGMRKRFDTTGQADKIFDEYKLKLNNLLAKYGLGVERVTGVLG